MKLKRDYFSNSGRITNRSIFNIQLPNKLNSVEPSFFYYLIYFYLFYGWNGRNLLNVTYFYLFYDWNARNLLNVKHTHLRVGKNLIALPFFTHGAWG